MSCMALVEGVARVQIARQPVLQRAGLRQRVAVDFQQIVHRHAVAGQVEIGQIGQQETNGVAQAAIVSVTPFGMVSEIASSPE